MADTRPLRFIDKATVLSEVGVTYTTLWNWICQGKFPRSFKLADRSTAWDAEEVEAWKRSRPRTRLKGDSEEVET